MSLLEKVTDAEGSLTCKRNYVGMLPFFIKKGAQISKEYLFCWLETNSLSDKSKYVSLSDA